MINITKCNYKGILSFNILLLFISLVIIQSCNIHIEKRKFGKGFYIQTNHQKNVKDESFSLKSDTISKIQLAKNDSPINLESNISSSSVVHDQSENTTEIHSNNLHKLKTEKDFFKNNKPSAELLKRKSRKTDAMTFKKHSQKENKNNEDYIFYALATFLGIITLGWMKRSTSRMHQLKKWAKNHNKISFGLLIFFQLLLGAFGFLIGKNLFELGFQGSNSMFQIFGLISSLSLFGILFRKRKNGVPLRGFYRQTIPQLVIGVSFWMSGIGIGNQTNSEGRLVTPVGKIIDMTEVSQSEELKLENLTENNQNGEISDEEKRGWMIFGFVLLSILVLLICFGLTCAVWCWALSDGTAGPITAAIVVSLVILGLLFLMFSGMAKKVSRKYPKSNSKGT